MKKHINSILGNQKRRMGDKRMELVEAEVMRKVTALNAEELEEVFVKLDKNPHVAIIGKRNLLLKVMLQFLSSEDVDEDHFVKIFDYLTLKLPVSDASVKPESKTKPSTSLSPHPQTFCCSI